MKRFLTVLFVLLLVIGLSQQAFARTRIERWMDVSGNYNYNGTTGLSWNVSTQGYLNFVMGVNSRLNTTLDMTLGMDGTNYTNDTSLLVSANYSYNASRYTSYTLGSSFLTLQRDSVNQAVLNENSQVQTDALLSKYISRRLSWRAGFEHWYYSAQAAKFKLTTRLLYNVPFGKYLSKASLSEDIFFGRTLGANALNEISTRTIFTYDFYKRMSLVVTAQFVFNSPGSDFFSWSKSSWDEKKIELVYHFY